MLLLRTSQRYLDRLAASLQQKAGQEGKFRRWGPRQDTVAGLRGRLHVFKQISSSYATSLSRRPPGIISAPVTRSMAADALAQESAGLKRQCLGVKQAGSGGGGSEAGAAGIPGG